MNESFLKKTMINWRLVFSALLLMTGIRFLSNFFGNDKFLNEFRQNKKESELYYESNLNQFTEKDLLSDYVKHIFTGSSYSLYGANIIAFGERLTYFSTIFNFSEKVNRVFNGKEFYVLSDLSRVHFRENRFKIKLSEAFAKLNRILYYNNSNNLFHPKKSGIVFNKSLASVSADLPEKFFINTFKFSYL